MRAVPVRAATQYGELHGTIQDDRGAPLTGAVVSALGSTAAFAMSDKEGRYIFRNLPPGAYLVRAHLEGYAAPRGQYVQVNAGGREAWAISMEPAAPMLLSAGVGGAAPAAPQPDAAESEGGDELAWRLRHLKRSVLKDAGFSAIEADGGTLDVVSRSSGRMAAALFDDFGLTGQVNLLTTTSFDRPQDLFSIDGEARRPVAYVSVIAPTSTGDWAVRGSLTQGDVSSWILAGSFTRRAPTPHVYEIGASYATQRYQGGNTEALAAVSERGRNAGELYVGDTWTITPEITVGASAKYATYGYLTDRALLSGRMGGTFKLSRTDPLRVTLSVAHREIAPGAEEFLPPSSGLWLPPERTFSALARSPFRPERLDHVEFAGEREVRGHFIVGIRAFRQRVYDQILTVFGDVGAESPATLGHYHVGTMGDVDTHGWGFSVTRTIFGDGTEASVAYTQVDADPQIEPAFEDLLLRVTPSVVRDEERIHDLTASVRSRVDATATRLFVVYKLNNAYAGSEAAMPVAAARFEVQINQELPFLDFTGAQWEMLVGVRNLFRSDLYDGSVYDELLVIRPPKRVMGGVTVRF